ncbi:hypothetical protein SKAU_G00288480 [Synaphobranchus kaupii]|uniref:Uncharacterized protein n=1 Tax=Synaphobranchus kaupii TaxID=118154 RepID=A0A9Q1ETG6_SYNKA|nr:hypothetical protein SKAU_G00288480 [Synaphobranchus kaupii]
MVVNMRPYRVPEVLQKSIVEIEWIKRLRVIEEACSAWSNPVVMVLNSSLRFCNDFRQLSVVSDFDANPIPRAGKLIECLRTVFAFPKTTSSSRLSALHLFTALLQFWRSELGGIQFTAL